MDSFHYVYELEEHVNNLHFACMNPDKVPYVQAQDVQYVIHAFNITEPERHYHMSNLSMVYSEQILAEAQMRMLTKIYEAFETDGFKNIVREHGHEIGMDEPIRQALVYKIGVFLGREIPDISHNAQNFNL